MKLSILLYFTCFLTHYVCAQKIHVNTFLGVSNYTGDLQDKRFTLNQSHLALGAGISYELSNKVFIRSELRLAKVGADDKFSKFSYRNLNFTSKIYDGQIVGEYYFRNLYEHFFSPYVFAGVGVYRFNPTTIDSSGNKIDLQQLSTEGQGFYQDRQEYKLTQLSIPIGAGVKFALSDNIRTGIEIGVRKLFTDYLDDVSTTFIDENLLLTNRGAKAVEMAFRSGELKTGLTYPPEGSQRGDARYKDLYYFIGITTSFRIGRFGGDKRNNSKTGCPVILK